MLMSKSHRQVLLAPIQLVGACVAGAAGCADGCGASVCVASRIETASTSFTTTATAYKANTGNNDATANHNVSQQQ